LALPGGTVVILSNGQENKNLNFECWLLNWVRRQKTGSGDPTETRHAVAAED
jgi:hypothetical protein